MGWGGGESQGGGRARRVPRVDYRQTTPRGPRKRKAPASGAYMDADGARAGHVTLSRAVVVGERTIDRVVGDRYEWRDGAFAKRRRVVFDDGG